MRSRPAIGANRPGEPLTRHPPPRQCSRCDDPATVATQGLCTPYALLGDVVAWASVIALVVGGGGVLRLSALRRHARRRKAGDPPSAERFRVPRTAETD